MFQQRPMPPMNSRGFFPPVRQMPMQGQPFGGPLPFQPLQQARGAGGGGLRGILSRFLPGSRGIPGGNALMGAGRLSSVANATQGLQGLTNPANISSMLGNVQKVLGMAQQVTPLVQQYGPLVKNLPAMWKIYRELQSNDDNTNDDESTSSTNKEETNNNDDDETNNNDENFHTLITSDGEEIAIETTKNKTEKTSRIQTRKGSSAPKMYI